MKRVIFILLICALLVHPRAWALEDVTILKEEVGSKSQQTSSTDLKDLIKKLEDVNESIRQEAKKQLLDRIWQKSVRPLAEKWEFEEGDILLSDIDGNGTKEIIAVWGEWPSYITVVDETLSTIQVIEIGYGPVRIVKFTDLFGEGKQALIIENGIGGSGEGSWWIDIYQWGQGKFNKVWSEEIKYYSDWFELRYARQRFGIPAGFSAVAKAQIVDLDQDGIREIVRIGEIRAGEYEWREREEQLKEGQETRQAKVEMEIGDLEIANDTYFSKVTSGYDVVYRFKETYFWNKAFNRYIQYKARLIKDTTAKDGSESVSIPSGTMVGVLGRDLEDYMSNSVSVVLPDGRIVSVDKGILERIRPENERDR